MMRIFIDESGSFSGFQQGAIGVVGAIAIPDKFLPKIEIKYAKIRKRLRKVGGEVKGRLLNEAQVADIVTLLARNHAIFEVTAIDVGAHTPEYVTAYQQDLAKIIEGRLPRFNAEARADLQKTANHIRKTSIPLFLQATTAFDVLQSVIKHVPLYFAQRQPEELGSFSWVVDGKEPAKVTEWEKWWVWHAQGALSTMSRSDPRPMLNGADYSHFDRFDVRTGTEVGTDLKLLLADLRFSSEAEPGLELVDIVVNAVRRAMLGNLAKEGWADVRRLMIHRPQHYIGLMLLGDTKPPTNPRYAEVVAHFSRDGKSMLSPRFMRMAEEDE